MYYLELIQRFWDFNQRIPIGSTGISMYLYLLKNGYENDRYDFQISDVLISKELGLTRKTVKATKEKLKNLGLIQFQTKNGIPCSYKLVLDYPLNISEPKIVKKKEFKTEQSSQKIKKPSTPIPSVSSIQNVPSLEELIEYAKTLDNYEVELDSKIQSKYENWKNNGWKNTYDRPITNWKSTLKSTLPYLKNTPESESLSLQSIPNIKRPKSQNDN